MPHLPPSCLIDRWFRGGDARFGGDSSQVQDQLKNVQQVVGGPAAFAAIIADGSVVTWGEGPNFGDTSGLQEQLLFL